MGIQGSSRIIGFILFAVICQNLFRTGECKAVTKAGRTPSDTKISDASSKDAAAAVISKRNFVITGTLPVTNGGYSLPVMTTRALKKKGRKSKSLFGCGSCSCDHSSVSPDPVCGTDSITYPNLCTLNCLSNCYWRGHLMMKHEGECESLDREIMMNNQQNARSGLRSRNTPQGGNNEEDKSLPQSQYPHSQAVWGKNLFFGGANGGMMGGNVGNGNLNRGFGQFASEHYGLYDDHDGYTGNGYDDGYYGEPPFPSFTSYSSKGPGPGTSSNSSGKFKTKSKPSRQGPSMSSIPINVPNNKGPERNKGPMSVGEGFALFCYDCSIYLQNQVGSGGVQVEQQEEKVLIK